MRQFRQTIKCSLIATGIILSFSCYAENTAKTPAPASDKKEIHDHKHQLPTEVPIPHRLEPMPTQAHPEEAKRRLQRTESLPQK